MKFTELQLDEQLLEAMSYMGFENATPIQEQAIPVILDNKDLIACAQTGTGKTGAFMLPILNKLVIDEGQGTNAMIIVPTRELAIQIEQLVQGLSYFTNISSIAIYGGGDGKDWDIQKNAMENGADIIVATPGKLLSFLRQGFGKLDHLKHFVLDEADRMLDMGFSADIQSIISFLPKDRQNLLFSATMPDSIGKLAKKLLVDPSEIKLSISKPAAGVDQKTYLTYDSQKIGVIKHLLKERKDYTSIIVFTSTKSKISEIVRALNSAGFPSKGISSNLDQTQREEVLSGFRSKKIRIIVATDVMSRGIDIKEINMVINYDVPHDAEDYVHRVGRTARANTKGEAVTLINQKDMYRFRKIEKLIETSIPKLTPPEDLGEGPEWQDQKNKSGNNRNKKSNNKKGNFKKRVAPNQKAAEEGSQKRPSKRENVVGETSVKTEKKPEADLSGEPVSPIDPSKKIFKKRVWKPKAKS